MTEHFELKPLSEAGVIEAIRKAEHYRLLNEPEQAESICRDVLRLHPEDPRALITIVLALTDQFSSDKATAMPAAHDYVGQLKDEYQRTYYSGLICERQARALLAKGMAGAFAYDAFRDAMDWYEKAEKIRPAGQDDAILRWNSCVRAIRRAKLEPPGEEPEHPLE